ncbi:soma ferritin-like [Topomyia yanbarensis]|uniref:soma ferritin-like n=1 Tax=Topomyia yanbarensis TaxID=2498891 RepID=UPI00273C3D91|nr:soma ferritin-like [Topomyia yanbarensis]
MKLFVSSLVTITVLLSSVNAALPDQLCTTDTRKCTSRFSGYKYLNNDLTDITTQLLDQSFDFLFLSAAFNQVDRNRPGFEKLYRNIANRAWSDAIAVMQYQSKRGYRGSLNPGYSGARSELRRLADPAAASEHESLQLAMEYEKLVSEGLHAISKKASVAHQHPAQYDPDVVHFLDHQLIQRRSESVRKLNGYIHMLDGILNADSSTADVGLRLFDEYLDSRE